MLFKNWMDIELSWRIEKYMQYKVHFSNIIKQNIQIDKNCKSFNFSNSSNCILTPSTYLKGNYYKTELDNPIINYNSTLKTH